MGTCGSKSETVPDESAEDQRNELTAERAVLEQRTLVGSASLG
jgi:UTP:GlnB (protein PII) uridylyltransferase